MRWMLAACVCWCGCYESHGLDDGRDASLDVALDTERMSRRGHFLVAHDSVVEERSLEEPTRIYETFPLASGGANLLSLNPLPGGFAFGWLVRPRMGQLVFQPWTGSPIDMPSVTALGYITHRGDVTYFFGNLQGRLDPATMSWINPSIATGLFGLDGWYYAQGRVARTPNPPDPDVREEFESAEFPEHDVRVLPRRPARLLVDANGYMSHPDLPESRWMVHSPDGSVIGVHEYPMPTQYPALGHDGTILWVNEDMREIYRGPVTLESYEVLMEIPDSWECPCFAAFAINALE